MKIKGSMIKNISGTLIITIVKANLLRDTDLFSKMDPYCILTINGFVGRTSIKKNAGKEPVWKERLAFRI